MRKRLLLALTILGVCGLPAAAQQPTPLEAKIDHRHAVMEGSGMAGVALLRMSQGLIEKENVPMLFDYWAKGARLSVEAFRTDTREAKAKSRAKDAIWENWDDFEDKMIAYAEDVESLAALAAEGNESKAFDGLGDVFKTHCRECHQDYRLKEAQ